MKRFLTDKLIEWKNSKYRKPLILRGARQVGKTYILKDFANTYYDNMAYFNFDHDSSLADLFVNTKDPKRIIEQLSFVVGRKIEPANTLIIFDEVQECPDALNSLKYFAEETPEYHIVAAGSLLGIKLSHTSFPVGKVDYLTLYPMTFSEFLIADGKENLVEYIKSIKEIQEIPKIFDEQLVEQLKKYYIIGGMPEVVNSWVNDKDQREFEKNLLESGLNVEQVAHSYTKEKFEEDYFDNVNLLMAFLKKIVAEKIELTELEINELSNRFSRSLARGFLEKEVYLKYNKVFCSYLVSFFESCGINITDQINNYVNEISNLPEDNYKEADINKQFFNFVFNNINEYIKDNNVSRKI